MTKPLGIMTRQLNQYHCNCVQAILLCAGERRRPPLRSFNLLSEESEKVCKMAYHSRGKLDIVLHSRFVGEVYLAHRRFSMSALGVRRYSAYFMPFPLALYMIYSRPVLPASLLSNSSPGPPWRLAAPRN